ncbi:MAG: hypothetical protein DHS80DRAFT_24905 [Piptocephalis tieghemiana]|nr:MAG: hypothetical protein DHS80DRAFT_24905 [Piptocephalis tieghemiana]
MLTSPTLTSPVLSPSVLSPHGAYSFRGSTSISKQRIHQRSPLTYLPIEVMTEILQYLPDPADLGNLLCTHRSLWHPVLMILGERPLCLAPEGQGYEDQVRHLALSKDQEGYAVYVKRLHLDLSSILADQTLDHVSTLLHHLPNLTHLTLKLPSSLASSVLDYMFRLLGMLEKQLPGLVALQVDLAPGVVPFSSPRANIPPTPPLLPKLRRWESPIHGPREALWIAQAAPNLTHVTWHFSPEYMESENELVQALFLLPRLHDLKLLGVPNGAESLAASRFCPELSRLTVHERDWERDHWTLLGPALHARSLYLARALSLWSREGGSIQCPSSPGLTHLDLSVPMDVTSSYALSQVFAPTLVHLTLRYAFSVTVASVIWPRLQSFQLYGCHLLDISASWTLFPCLQSLSVIGQVSVQKGHGLSPALCPVLKDLLVSQANLLTLYAMLHLVIPSSTTRVRIHGMNFEGDDAGRLCAERGVLRMQLDDSTPLSIAIAFLEELIRSYRGRIPQALSIRIPSSYHGLIHDLDNHVYS